MLLGVTVSCPVLVTPVPDSGTFCGLLLALSVKLSVALRVPVPPGVKVTKTVQLDPAVRLAAQLLVFVKSAAFVPEIPIPLMEIDDVIPFVSFTDFPTLVEPTVTFPNAMEVGLTENVAAVPSPVRATVRGLLLPAILKFNVALRGPVAVGAKATYTTQFDDAPSDDPHVVPLAFLKSLAFAPVNEMLNVIPLAFEFVRVTGLSAPVLPITTEFQLTLVVEAETAARQFTPARAQNAIALLSTMVRRRLTRQCARPDLKQSLK
jgi:hypothetical protein